MYKRTWRNQYRDALTCMLAHCAMRTLQPGKLAYGHNMTSLVCQRTRCNNFAQHSLKRSQSHSSTPSSRASSLRNTQQHKLLHLFSTRQGPPPAQPAPLGHSTVQLVCQLMMCTKIWQIEFEISEGL